jgi:hypothetical protein
VLGTAGPRPGRYASARSGLSAPRPRIPFSGEGLVFQTSSPDGPSLSRPAVERAIPRRASAPAAATAAAASLLPRSGPGGVSTNGLRARSATRKRGSYLQRKARSGDRAGRSVTEDRLRHRPGRPPDLHARFWAPASARISIRRALSACDRLGNSSGGPASGWQRSMFSIATSQRTRRRGATGVRDLDCL